MSARGIDARGMGGGDVDGRGVDGLLLRRQAWGEGRRAEERTAWTAQPAEDETRGETRGDGAEEGSVAETGDDGAEAAEAAEAMGAMEAMEAMEEGGEEQEGEELTAEECASQEDEVLRRYFARGGATASPEKENEASGNSPHSSPRRAAKRAVPSDAAGPPRRWGRGGMEARAVPEQPEQPEQQEQPGSAPGSSSGGEATEEQGARSEERRSSAEALPALPAEGARGDEGSALAAAPAGAQGMQGWAKRPRETKLQTRGVLQAVRGPAPLEVEAFGERGVLQAVRGPAPPEIEAFGERGVLQSEPGPTPAAVLLDEFIEAHDDAVLQDSGKVLCTTTGHELPARLGDVQDHWDGRRYRKAHQRKSSCEGGNRANCVVDWAIAACMSNFKT